MTELNELSLHYGYHNPNASKNISITPKTIEMIMRTESYAGVRCHNRFGLTNEDGFYPNNPWLPKSNEGTSGCADAESMFCMLSRVKPLDTDRAFENPHSELGSGGQTLDIVTMRTLPASQAYASWLLMLSDNNLTPNTPSIRSFCISTLKLLQRREIIMRETSFGEEKTTITPEEFYSRMTTIMPVIKQGERGKDKQRPIVIMTLGARGFQMITEAASESLIEDSAQIVLTQGGDEKKAKISQLIDQVRASETMGCRAIIVNSDFTKWNECISPVVIYCFCAVLGEKLNIDDAMMLCYYATILLDKKLPLGDGFPIIKNGKRTKITCEELVKLKRAGLKIRKDWVEMADFLDENFDRIKGNKLVLPNGMMMGMLNRTSTAICVALMQAVCDEVKVRYNVDVLFNQSSDDVVFALIFPSDEKDGVDDLIEAEGPINQGHRFYQIMAFIISSLRQVGFNLSTKKTTFTPSPLVELTGVYHGDDSWHISSAQEVMTTIPPHTSAAVDVQIVFKNTRAAVMKGIGPCTAYLMMKSGISTIRQISKVDGFEEYPLTSVGLYVKLKIGKQVAPIIMGGIIPWIHSNLSLDELAIKMQKVPEEKRLMYLAVVTGNTKDCYIKDNEEGTYKNDRMRSIEFSNDVPSYGAVEYITKYSHGKSKGVESMISPALHIVQAAIKLIDPTAIVVKVNDTRSVYTALQDIIAFHEVDGAKTTHGVGYLGRKRGRNDDDGPEGSSKKAKMKEESGASNSTSCQMLREQLMRSRLKRLFQL